MSDPSGNSSDDHPGKGSLPGPGPGSGLGSGQGLGGVEYAIIAGYGPVGRAVGQSLERQGINITVIETNPATVERQAEQGKTFVFGDATDPDILLTAGIKHAQVLVLAIPDEDQACAACTEARKLNPGVFILARANFLSKGMLCTRAGADRVIVEELVTAQAMHDAVMKAVERGEVRKK